jgi:hypothetical protein
MKTGLRAFWSFMVFFGTDGLVLFLTLMLPLGAFGFLVALIAAFFAAR